MTGYYVPQNLGGGITPCLPTNHHASIIDYDCSDRTTMKRRRRGSSNAYSKPSDRRGTSRDSSDDSTEVETNSNPTHYQSVGSRSSASMPQSMRIGVRNHYQLRCWLCSQRGNGDVAHVFPRANEDEVSLNIPKPVRHTLNVSLSSLNIVRPASSPPQLSILLRTFSCFARIAIGHLTVPFLDG